MYDVCGSAGRAIAQAVSRWLPTEAARVRARVWQVGFVVDKVALGQVSSEYFVSPVNLHSTNSSIITITRGRYNRSFSGRRAEWTQYGFHPPPPHYADKKNVEVQVWVEHC
jgi:hypothetical protein